MASVLVRGLLLVHFPASGREDLLGRRGGETGQGKVGRDGLGPGGAGIAALAAAESCPPLLGVGAPHRAS